MVQVLDAEQVKRGFREVEKRLDWQVTQIRKIPGFDITLLSEEYNTKVGGAENANPNLRNEFVINEYSIRAGNGKNLYTVEREAVIYSGNG